MNSDQELLPRFYKRVLKSPNLAGIFIPRSDVHYVRRAIYERTGEWFTLEHVSISMWLEGYLPPNEISKIPDWYVDKYMKGCYPDMVKLKEEIKVKYRKFLQSDGGTII